MNNNIIPIGQARRATAMTAHVQAGATVNKNFADNVGDSFPKLSIKGKVFRIRIDGKETPLIDQQTRQPIPFLDVVLVNASATLAKSYYDKGFSEGDFDPPVCWSMDSVRPDPSVANKQSPTCINCPKNAFGSKITDSGKAAKACTDARRIAVVMPSHLGTDDDPFVFLMRVPQASLKNLKAYSQLLDRQGYNVPGCVTRLTFDYKEAFPKLEFQFVDGLDDAEYAQTMELAESDAVAAMLMAPDFDAEVSTTQPAQPTTGRAARQAAPIMEDTGLPPSRQATPAGTETDPAKAAVDALRASAPVTAAFAKPEPEPAKPTAVASTLIELPDGRQFNTATGEYVERPAAKVAEPQLDPNIIALPDGRFFNKTTNKFVVSGVIGAVEVTVEEPPKRRAPKRATAKAAEAGAGGAATPAANTAPPAEMKALDAAEEQGATSMDDGLNGTGEDGEDAEVLPAPRGLNELLDSALPSRKR